VQAGPAWQPNLVRDGNLITGQNPASSEVVAREVLAALGPAPEAAQDDEADDELDEDIQ
jgi:putative intracellular protease/amidase